MGFNNPPTIIFDEPPIPKRHPQISPHIHQKMRIRCESNYIEAFDAVYWATKLFLQKNLRGYNNPLRRTRVKIHFESELFQT